MWQKFKHHKPAYISLWILGFLCCIALFAPFLANEKPLMVKLNGNYFFPVFTPSKSIIFYNPETFKNEKIQFDIAEWKKIKTDWILWAPVTFSPGKSDLMNSGYISPFTEQKIQKKSGEISTTGSKFRHWLGTGKRGEDLLSGLIHGTYISLSIGIISMGIASIIGIVSGAIAGYYGDYSFTSKRSVYLFSTLGLIPGFFYGFLKRKFILADSLSQSFAFFTLELFLSLLICFLFLLIFYMGGKLSEKSSWFGLNKQVSFPVDSILNRTIEILVSMPRLILIISVAAIAKPSVFILMFIIGATSWTGIARFVRAEFLRIRTLDYISAAKALGYTNFRIIFFHALPNALAPVFVTIAFGIASAILIESGLSFLGIGVPADVVTWGSLLNAGRENFNAWWLVLFPGLAIFITVTVYNLIGEGLRDALDPRLKNEIITKINRFPKNNE
ncbi:MAG: hypothetical protein A3G23_07515 [Bacteroidetes bacterium RIFCSPLOWO2_12_FULL_37_12]|nr:MAG: hypothetical protein A3G23_07515 [Bacteroidetes bacterium RIFCSPLOWO2_12_FULL_37_12]